MAFQTSGNILVALKVETTIGVAVATVTGATRLRITDSPGLTKSRAIVQSEENRADGLKTMGRLGFKGVDGSYSAELTPGGATDILLEGITRGTWTTLTSVTFATMTSVTIGTNEVVANAGDWVGAQGIRVGDIFRLSNHGEAANNDLNTRVTAVTSLTISTPDTTFTADASAATTGTLSVLRKLITGTTPTRRSYQVEQYDVDTDLSEVFLGNRVTGFSLSASPGDMVQVTYTMQGLNNDPKVTGTSPYYTSPSLTTTLGLIADDASIRFNGADITKLTGFNLDFSIDANGEPTIGSLVSPDIFDNDMTVSGSVTGLREDFSNLTLFDAETIFEISIVMQGSTGEEDPPTCLAIYIPQVKIAALSAPVGGGDGAKIETLDLMIGPKTASTGNDGTVVAFHSSEAP